jgi:hypothetical protein
MLIEWTINVALVILGAVLGALTSYFFYQLGKRLKEPTWAIRSNNLIRRGEGLALPKFDMRYDGVPVQNLTLNQLVIVDY